MLQQGAEGGVGDSVSRARVVGACCVGKSIFGLDAHEELMLPVTEMLSSPSLHLG